MDSKKKIKIIVDKVFELVVFKLENLHSRTFIYSR